MKYCKRCVQPDSRPGALFNKEGLCGSCQWQEEKKSIDWDVRWKELEGIAEWAKKTSKSVYNCVIGVSGGKDSTFQTLTAHDRLGLRPLLVNSEPEGITDIGRANIEHLINMGFDTIKLRPNPKVMRRLVKRDFYKYLNPVKITEYSLWSSAYIIADMFNIPLIIQGENIALTEGSRNTGLALDGNALNADQIQTLSSGWEEYLDTATKDELFLFHYDKERLVKKGIKGVWLQYYAKEWSYPRNAAFSIAHGLIVRPDYFDPNEIGTHVPYAQMDSDLVQVNQMLKYIKFGFGQCSDHASHQIRDGLITRKEAVELARKYDGKCSIRYIKKFCDYIEISVEEFWRVANSFRGPIWKKNAEDEWVLKNPVWEETDSYEKAKVR
jgi:N-acetyl sugar amidotransferase